ncbi:MAG TPA: hypothetical protein VF493_20015 [Terriglobales bacterium]
MSEYKCPMGREVMHWCFSAWGNPDPGSPPVNRVYDVLPLVHADDHTICHPLLCLVQDYLARNEFHSEPLRSLSHLLEKLK